MSANADFWAAAQQQHESMLAAERAKKRPVAANPSSPRHKPGKMNKTEAAFALWLEAAKQNGELSWFAFEGITLKLIESVDGSMKGVRYTPDFAAMTAAGALVFYECKGFSREDWWIKFKLAVNSFPFTFHVVKRTKGGGWDITPYRKYAK